MTEFVFNRQKFKDQETFIKSGRRCATAVPTDLQISRVASELRTFRQTGVRVQNAEIKVQFIHIMSGAEGKIEEEQRVQQIQVLNDAYNNHGITFTYDPSTVVEVDRPDWYHMGHRSAAERQAKTALHVDPNHNLNFYTADLQGGLLGWATFPFDLVGDPDMDGVVVLKSALPGGTAAPYNLGDTATHEIGHWLGLYHTFEPRGTCDDIDDRIEDTVAHRDPDYGKPPPGVYTACDGVSLSPVKNFMNYTDDDWMDHFTEGQAVRMKEQIGMYRPDLALAEPPPPTEAELKFTATASGHLARTGDERIFSVRLPGKAVVNLDGPGGVDFDLYLRRDAAPTEGEYDDRSYSAGPDESLTTPETPGIYYVMARSYRGAGNFDLTIELE
jgi:hypothetical protein